MELIKEHFSKTPKQPIYHYTSQEGIIGILKKKELWASKIQYLNDATEFSYAFDLLRSRLEDKYSDEDETFLKSIINSIDGSEYLNFFAASFSERGDLLSQWRAYCPQTGGYNIGFHYDDLEWALDQFNFKIVPCEYNKIAQYQLLDELIEASLSHYNNVGKTGWEEETPKYKEEFIRLAPVLKHPAFKEENEWRAVSSLTRYSNSKVDYRPGESMIVPYFKLKLSKEDKKVPFHKINIGPTPHKKLSERSISGLLFKTGHFEEVADQAKVEHSQIPYRTW